MRREAKGERRVRQREMESQRQTRERGGHKGFLVGTKGRSGAESGGVERIWEEMKRGEMNWQSGFSSSH
jgi:hypothetical protein